MNQKYIGIVVVLALLAGVYVMWTRSSSISYKPTPVEAPGRGVVGMKGEDSDPYDIEIVYTDNGYVPTEITVPKGTRIRFINESNAETWPASGIHPTHTLYPEKESSDCLGSSFDSCKALAQGEFFDFTFNYVGNWSFHDHLHGYHSGVINVR
jgi:plastocyanin